MVAAYDPNSPKVRAFLAELDELDTVSRNWVTNHPWPAASDSPREAQLKKRWRRLRELSETAPETLH